MIACILAGGLSLFSEEKKLSHTGKPSITKKINNRSATRQCKLIPAHKQEIQCRVGFLLVWMCCWTVTEWFVSHAVDFMSPISRSRPRATTGTRMVLEHLSTLRIVLYHGRNKGHSYSGQERSLIFGQSTVKDHFKTRVSKSYRAQSKPWRLLSK